jgi:hypothetical protein
MCWIGASHTKPPLQLSPCRGRDRHSLAHKVAALAGEAIYQGAFPANAGTARLLVMDEHPQRLRVLAHEECREAEEGYEASCLPR